MGNQNKVGSCRLWKACHRFWLRRGPLLRFKFILGHFSLRLPDFVISLFWQTTPHRPDQTRLNQLSRGRVAAAASPPLHYAHWHMTSSLPVEPVQNTSVHSPTIQWQHGGDSGGVSLLIFGAGEPGNRASWTKTWEKEGAKTRER